MVLAFCAPTRVAAMLACVAVVTAASCARTPLRVAKVDLARASDGLPVGAPASPQPLVSQLRLATFNAGLAVGVVKLASERAPRVAEALPGLGADLVCLQEVWLEEHWERVVSASGSSLPGAVRLPPLEVEAARAKTDVSSGAACSSSEVAPLVECARRSCAGLSSDSLAACVIGQCRTAARRVSPSCANCLARDPEGTVDSILAPCVGKKTGTKQPGDPSSLVAYGGSNGLGILTRGTILSQDALRLESDLNARAALHVRLRHDSFGDVDVFCTHLTPSVGNLAPPAGRTWRDVHAGQVDALSRWIDESTDGKRPAILLGDLNAGPALGTSIAARHADAYQRLVARGFVNAYLAQEHPLCTFCDANPLNGGSGQGGTLIDHILVRGFEGRVAVEPILRDSIEIVVGGTRVEGAHSDHYGLLATLTRQPD